MSARYHVFFLWLQIRQMKAEDRRDKIAVIVGTVTNDIRILTLPKLKVRACKPQHDLTQYM